MEEYFQAAGANGVIAGQVVDIESEKLMQAFEYGNDDEQLPEILDYIHTHKTADLFKLALRTGAIIADATEKQIEEITEFGQVLGVAFQIADDILDETSTFEEMGKTMGKDKEEGKLTYTALYGLDKAKKDLNLLIDKCFDILNRNDLKSEVFEQILKKIQVAGK